MSAMDRKTEKTFSTFRRWDKMEKEQVHTCAMTVRGETNMKFKRWICILLVTVMVFAGCTTAVKEEEEEPAQPVQTQEAAVESASSSSQEPEEEIEDEEIDSGLSILDLLEIAKEKGVTGVIGALLTRSFLDAQGEKIGLHPGQALEALLEKGMNTDVDPDEDLLPGQVSEPILLQLDKTKVTVRVMNPYDETVALKKGVICSVMMKREDAGMAGGLFGLLKISSKDVLKKILPAAYKDTGDELVYRFGPFSLDKAVASEDMPNLKLALVGKLELIIRFKNNIMDELEISAPWLLYNGLHDNMEDPVMHSENVQQAIEIRDSILERLRKAFEEKGIEVTIDEATGEIALDSALLFDVDKAELKQEGKDCVDSFIGVYTEVLMDDEFAEYIDLIRFEGHTDTTQSFDYNLKLSQKRADSVLNYCLESEKNGMNDAQREFLKEHAVSEGFSFSDPVYKEDGSIDMAASRRVCVKFYIKIEE